MKYSVILAHPTSGSYNHAIGDVVQRGIRARGGEVFYHDLYAERFDPVMPTEEIPKNAILPEAIENHCREIESADGIVIIHPNWWSQPPAILKGWVDRVLRPGRAYNFVADETGEVKPVGLLKAKVGLVINTANTPQEKEVSLLGDPQAVFWEKVVFGLCGVRHVRRLVFSPVIVSTPEQRRCWLEETRYSVDQILGS